MNNKVYVVMLEWHNDGDCGTDVIDVCDSSEKAQASLKSNAEFDWAEYWECMNLELAELDNYEWTNDYYDVAYGDKRTTIYIVEKEIK